MHRNRQNQAFAGDAKDFVLNSVLLLQFLSATLADNDARRHGIAGRNRRHHRAIGDAQALQAIDLQFPVDDRHIVAAHLACTGFVEIGARGIADEALEFLALEGPGHDFARSVSAGFRVNAQLRIMRSGEADTYPCTWLRYLHFA
jgi:hypothetical protein